ncbi:menaquinol-cytochrome C reductase [Paenibacillus sambharensis]|uniref:Menaquinol-cytochrome C reductase n=1 Tax=Paenibacillus sambharensis TaxID=1803190 RepID=A0A2W1LGG9_9BACL|nr:menaquinol-cytochrome c reductase cytochrome b/c subunit [Paenibacillus sambharensis]PZD93554.1 menaquinol-cytochrome C reductase [Paenibacillus sambharensis]
MSESYKAKERVVYVGDSRVRKGNMPNVPADYTSYPGKSEAFIPNFLLKEWMVGCVVLVGFLVLTITHPAPLGYPADPTNGAFIPMPDWYFLFIYQLLKYPYLSENYVVLGTIGIPGIAFGALLLAPFLDTGKERRFYRRPIASSLMILSLIACVYLTKVSWDHYTHELEKTNTIPEHIEREEKAREAAMAGQERPNYTKQPELPAVVDAGDPATSIIQAQCLSCHGTEYEGRGNIPPLRGVGDKYSKEEIAEIVTNGRGGMPAFGEGKGGNVELSAEEIDQVSTWLAKQKAAAE